MVLTRKTERISRRTALAGVGLGSLTFAASRHLAAIAQDASPVATDFPREGHPLVGVWEVNKADGGPAPITFAIFDVDGTYLHYWSPFLAIGFWRPTGARTAEGVEFYEVPQSLERLFDLASPIPDDVLEQQPIKNRWDAEVDAGGKAFKGEGNVVDEQGNATGAYGEIQGVRLGVVAPAATPTG